MTITSTRINTKLAIGIAAVVAGSFSASAVLNYDLRATALNGVPLAPEFAKGGNGLLLFPNDVVTFTVYAQVTGTSGDNLSEGYQSGWFNLLAGTTAGSAQGSFLPFNPGVTRTAVLPAFATGAFNAGTPTDTNADGFNDRLGGQRTLSSNSIPSPDLAVRILVDE